MLSVFGLVTYFLDTLLPSQPVCLSQPASLPQLVLFTLLLSLSLVINRLSKLIISNLLCRASDPTATASDQMPGPHAIGQGSEFNLVPSS